MKKIYIQPELICCVLQSKMMMAVSGQLSETSAVVGDEGNLNNDVKGIGDVDLWDEVW